MPPAARKCPAEVVLVEQPFDTKGKTSGMSHGNSYLCQARHGREFKKNLRIRRVAGRLSKAGAVTDGLAQVRELAPEPPAQGLNQKSAT